MSSYGFVYILGNDRMPDLYKIGCTERSPHARAAELSQPTGVPCPFDVLCYAEFEDFQAIERKMHEWCKDSRVNNGREFFDDCLQWAVSLLWFHPKRLSFTDATADQRYPDMSRLRCMVCDVGQTFQDLPNPFLTAEQRAEAEAAKALAVASADESASPLVEAGSEETGS